MELADILRDYGEPFKARYGKSTTPDQWSALNAILGCRTGQYGDIVLSCNDCHHTELIHQSCGHRSCNKCQNHATTQWLERQQAKLLPVKYFMVTFTVPRQLRALIKSQQKIMYALLFRCAAATLKEFGVNDKSLACDLAMTAVLHTHKRNLDFHPHIHIIVPGGGVNRARKEWRKVKCDYLFNAFNLAKVFRAKLLAGIKSSGFYIPFGVPKKWVVDCENVGHGLPALQYLSRYLYRGVIQSRNIISDDGKFITFRYIDSQSKESKTRKLLGEDFIRLILQHTLPKGFRRARDYGFLHGNAKRLLQFVQLILRVKIPQVPPRDRPEALCRKCQAPLVVVGFRRPKPRAG